MELYYQYQTCSIKDPNCIIKLNNIIEDKRHQQICFQVLAIQLCLLLLRFLEIFFLNSFSSFLFFSRILQLTPRQKWPITTLFFNYAKLYCNTCKSVAYQTVAKGAVILHYSQKCCKRLCVVNGPFILMTHTGIIIQKGCSIYFFKNHFLQCFLSKCCRK